MARGVVRVGGGGEGGGEGMVEVRVVWCGQVVLRWWYDGGGGVCGEGGAVWRRWRVGGEGGGTT